MTMTDRLLRWRWKVLMRIDELLEDAARSEHAARPKADALTDSDALQEGELLDVRSNVSLGLGVPTFEQIDVGCK